MSKRRNGGHGLSPFLDRKIRRMLYFERLETSFFKGGYGFLRRIVPFFCKHARTAVALFFLAVLALGMITADDYGNAWDDLSEMMILRMALREYDALLPGETALGAALAERGVVRLSESVERDHGICLYYPLFWAVGGSELSTRQLTRVWRCHTWLLFTMGLFALYALAHRLGLSRPFACLGVLILLLSPRFFAEGHYNNKDIPLMAMTLVLFWQSVRLMEKPTLPRGLTFAAAAGCCVGTRIIGAAYCLLFGLMVVLGLRAAGKLNRRTLGVGVFTLLASLAFYVVLTPSLLADPVGFFEYLLKNAIGFSRWHGNILYFGEVISCASTKPPRLYLPVLIALTTPLWALALLGAGCILGVSEARRERRRLLSISSSLLRMTAYLAWTLPLLGLVIVHALVYNGWRHVYFLYGPIALCMADAFHTLWHRLRFKQGRRLLALAAAACLGISAIGIAANHPYQYAYFNALVPRENRAEQFELDWWNLSCANALQQLLSQTEGTLSVAPSDFFTRSGLKMAAAYLDEPRLCVVEGTEANKAQYVLSNLSYAAMAGFAPTQEMTPVVTLSAYGSPLTVIYALEGSDAS